MKILHSIIIAVVTIFTVAVVAVITFVLSKGACPRGSFACDNGTKCVLQREICDQRPDCADGTDEDAIECGHYHGSIDFTLSVLLGNGQPLPQPPVINTASDRCTLQFYPTPCICKKSTVLICKNGNLTEFPRVGPQVTSIYVRDNRLTLDNHSLGGLDISQILHLKHNHITQLPAHLFHAQRRLRKLFLDDNRIASIPAGLFAELEALEWLMLGDNRLRRLPLEELRPLRRLRTLNVSSNRLQLDGDDEEMFPPLPAIMEIYLESNRIEAIGRRLFGALGHLQFLSLSYNRIRFIDREAFAGLIDLRELKLSHNHIGFMDAQMFRHMTKLDALFVGFNDLKIQRNTLDYVNVSLLNLDGIECNHISFEAVRSVENLQAVVFDKFSYCSELPHIRKCKPNTDGVSSLTDLLTKPVLRYSTWMMAFIALLGNALVVWSRLTGCPDDNRAVCLVIVNLAVADALMGVYLAVIGVQDWRYRSGYQLAALDWTGSWQCMAIGMLAMVSCEVSLMIMVFMSVERFLLIADPFQIGWLRLKTAKVAQVMLVIWVVGMTLAAVPAILWRSSTRYYGTNTGVCFPLHLQEPFTLGWQYSAFVVLGLNLCALLLIGVLYSMLMVSILRTRRAAEVSQFDFEFAIRFFFIVFTDALCWTPIVLTKLCAFGGMEVSADFYAWLMVFVLPLNSAINPLLYTFTTPKYRKQVLTNGWNKFSTIRKGDTTTTEGSMTTTNPQNPADDTQQVKFLPLLASIGGQTLTKWKWWQ